MLTTTLFTSAAAAVLAALALAPLSATAVGGSYGDRIERARADRETRILRRAQYVEPRDTNSTTAGFRYRTNKTEPFLVISMPEVDFDFGEMYSGSIPLASNTSESLFFFFKPSAQPTTDLTIWFNGGPGCSSLEGFFQENGPIVWVQGTTKPVANPYAWHNLTNMLWVEQPVPTGFSIGTPSGGTEEGIAAEFVGWFKNWQTTFGVRDYHIYVTGESYAGRYVPFIADAIRAQNDTAHYDLKGALMYDPCIGDCFVTSGITPAYPFAVANNNLLGLNATFLNDMNKLDKKCGFKGVRDKYLTYPPPGHQPVLNYTDIPDECDVWDAIYAAVGATNPCFNIYHISEFCPPLSDPMSGPGGVGQTGNPYFNRDDVKAAIHAPNKTWAECTDSYVFTNNNTDTSMYSIEGPLPRIIEHTQRVLIANGDLDYIIINDGTLLAIQNMTWGGHLGFQTKPKDAFYVGVEDQQYTTDENGDWTMGPPQGIMGVQHFERGLMWNTIAMSGHMVPEYQPRAAYVQLQWLLGHIDDMGVPKASKASKASKAH